MLLKYITELTNYACNWFTAEALFPMEFTGDTRLKSLWNPATNQSPLWHMGPIGLAEVCCWRTQQFVLESQPSATPFLHTAFCYLQYCTALLCRFARHTGRFMGVSVWLPQTRVPSYSRSLSRVLASRSSRTWILSSKDSSAMQEFKTLIRDANKQSRKDRRNE